MTIFENPEEVRAAIAVIEAATSERFIGSRYPYTYAYDFMRSHARVLGLPTAISRSECAELVSGEDKDEVTRLLADAYLREHGIARPVRVFVDGTEVKL